MRLEVSDDVGFTPAELALIEKMRQALSDIHVPCYGTTSKGQVFVYDLAGFIVPASRTSPLSVDFRVKNRNLNGHAVIGPEKPLVERLFCGVGITPTFCKEIQAAVAEFVHCMETM